MKKTTTFFIAFFLLMTSISATIKESKPIQITYSEFSFKNLTTKTAQKFALTNVKKRTIFEKLGLKILEHKIGKEWGSRPPDCSKIVMKDGDVIEAVVIQISPTEIKYKRCGKPNDPEIVINKKDVLSIKAADGEIIFRNIGNNNGNNNDNNGNNGNNGNNSNNRDTNYGTNNSNNNNNSDEPKLQGSALAGMICGILGILLLGSILGLASGIVGIVLSLSGRKKINREPKRFKGKGMAMAGLICGIVACGLFVLAIL
jgi:hypothetical protein